MCENVKIAIIGGDARQAALARRLAEYGHEVAVFGLPRESDIGGAVRCRDVGGAILGSRAVILPLPALKKDGTVNAPFASELIEFSSVADKISDDCILVGGKLDETSVKAAKARGIRVFDYNRSELFQIKNAISTAEGAIEIAMHETDVTLFESRALILGYGRIGKAIFSMLKGISKEVTVAARKSTDRAYVEMHGGRAIPFFEGDFDSEIMSCDLVFNTVPSMVLPYKYIRKMRKSCVIIDLASGDGGIDFAGAKMLGIKTLHSLALPGKVAPVSAGKAICDEVILLLKGEGGDMEI